MPGRVIVCGGGLAGLAAAVTAAEAGARVLLVEKAPELGGSTALSTGLVWTFTDYERIRADIPHGDPALQWLVHDGVTAGRAWLAGRGVTFTAPADVLGHGHGQFMDPRQAIERLAARLTDLGGEIRTGAALAGLEMRDGAVAGVELLSAEGRSASEPAAAVVLATGGFHGNAELLARYVVEDPSHLLLRGNPWSTGDAFLAATTAGAAASPGLGRFYGHALIAPPGRRDLRDLGSASQFQGPLAVAVNLAGRRFTDESAGTGEEWLNQQLARQPEGRGFYITDQAALGDAPLIGLELVVRSVLDRARSAGAVVVTADSLEALVAGLAPHGPAAPVLLDELTRFNRLIESGRADALEPARRRHRRPLATPPFTAVAVQAAITFTMGGLQIDERTRVLARAGSTGALTPVPETRAFADLDGPSVALGSDYRQTAIPGLFAAGCDAGNISHAGYMGGLATALTTGRVAGTEAARRAAA